MQTNKLLESLCKISRYKIHIDRINETQINQTVALNHVWLISSVDQSLSLFPTISANENQLYIECVKRLVSLIYE